jgi:hypothetical protein
MAKVTVIISDDESDGSVNMSVEFEPELKLHDEENPPTMAQFLGVKCAKFLKDQFSDTEIVDAEVQSASQPPPDAA